MRIIRPWGARKCIPVCSIMILSMSSAQLLTRVVRIYSSALLPLNLQPVPSKLQ